MKNDTLNQNTESLKKKKKEAESLRYGNTLIHE